MMAVYLLMRRSVAPCLLLFLLPCVLPCPAFAQGAATDQPIGHLETVATFPGPMPEGVTVSHAGRIFVNFARWGDKVPFTVAEVVNGKAVAYPNEEINNWPGRSLPNPNASFVCSSSFQSSRIEP